MILGDNDTTKRIDSYAINELKIPGIILMENAALSFIKNIDLTFEKYLVVCGKGNNGGDGFAISRHLYSMGKKVSIYMADMNDIKNMSRDCRTNYDICKNLNIDIIDSNIGMLMELLIKCDCIVDSIFGTGLNSEIKGIYREIIEKINLFSKNKKIYSVDLPSGISGNTGEVLGIAVKAYKTVSFVTYKKAFCNIENIKYFGKIKIENIGLNKNDISHLSEEIFLDKDIIKSYEKIRHPLSHKGDFGRVLIFAGNEGYTGAGAICANSCVKSGAGLTTLLSFNARVNNNLIPEVMTLNIEKTDNEKELDKLESQILNSDVIAVGPGMGKSREAVRVLRKILNYNTNSKGYTIKLVIDADALNIIGENPELFKYIKGRAVLTPHIMEFSRISGLSLEEISNNRFKNSKKFSEKYNVVLLLKGKNTLITNGKKIYINSTGNSHMASGGMGDSLTGIIAALAAQKYTLTESANIGAYLHGYIGDRLLEKEYIINAGDIIENISEYLKEIFK